MSSQERELVWSQIIKDLALYHLIGNGHSFYLQNKDNKHSMASLHRAQKITAIVEEARAFSKLPPTLLTSYAHKCWAAKYPEHDEDCTECAEQTGLVFAVAAIMRQISESASNQKFRGVVNSKALNKLDMDSQLQVVEFVRDILEDMGFYMARTKLALSQTQSYEHIGGYPVVAAVKSAVKFDLALSGSWSYLKLLTYGINVGMTTDRLERVLELGQQIDLNIDA